MASGNGNLVALKIMAASLCGLLASGALAWAGATHIAIGDLRGSTQSSIEAVREQTHKCEVDVKEIATKLDTLIELHKVEHR